METCPDADPEQPGRASLQEGSRSQVSTNNECWLELDENVATHMVLQHRCDRFVLIQLAAVSYPTIYVLSRTAYDLSRQLRKKKATMVLISLVALI